MEYEEILTQAEIEQSFRDSMEYVVGSQYGIFDPIFHINPFEIIFKDENKSLLDKLAKNDFDVI